MVLLLRFDMDDDDDIVSDDIGIIVVNDIDGVLVDDEMC